MFFLILDNLTLEKPEEKAITTASWKGKFADDVCLISQAMASACGNSDKLLARARKGTGNFKFRLKSHMNLFKDLKFFSELGKKKELNFSCVLMCLL